MMYFMNRIIILVFLSCFFLAGNTWADSNKSADYADEKPVIKIYPYTFGQLPPTYYGETNLPVGEVLIINISRFPVSSQGESAVISVLSADEKTKPSFTPETKGMNKWMYTGNIDNFTFGAYKVTVSAINENISGYNIFRIKP